MMTIIRSIALIDLQMVSEVKSYTTDGQPLFYLYPIRFDNRSTLRKLVTRDVREMPPMRKQYAGVWVMVGACLLPASC